MALPSPPPPKNRLHAFNPFESIGIRLFLTIFVCIMLLVGTLGWVSYRTSEQVIKKKVADAVSQTIVQAADKLDFFLSTYESSTRTMLVDQSLLANLAIYTGNDSDFNQKDAAKTAISKKLLDYVSADKRVLSLRLIPTSLAKDAIINSNGASGIGISLDQSIFTQITKADGQAVWFSTRQKGIFGYSPEPTITQGRLLKNMKNPAAQMYIIMEIKEQAMADMYANVKVGDNGRVWVLAEDQRITYAADAAQLESPFTLPLPDRTEGTAESAAYLTIPDEGEQLAITMPSDVNGWTTVGMLPAKEMIKDMNKIVFTTLLVIAGAIVAASAIGLWLILRVGKPLGSLSRLMEEGEKGRLDIRTPLAGRDEIGRLGITFNRMMDQIQQLVGQTDFSVSSLSGTAMELSQVSQATSAAASEIASAAAEMAEGADRLFTEADKGFGLAGQMGDRMSLVVQSNDRMRDTSKQIEQDSDRGAQSMNELKSNSEITESLMRGLETKVSSLKGSAQSINRILEIMTQQAKQTNILSLNASIEAARAGSAGRGFMVVANEIRQLADQSQQSIRVVSEITEGIEREVEDTAAFLEEAAPLMKQQQGMVREATDIFDVVKQHMEDFVQQLSDVSGMVVSLGQDQQVLMEAMHRVNVIAEMASGSTQQVASRSQEQSAIGEHLVALSGQLEEMSEQMKFMLVRYTSHASTEAS